MMSSFNRDRLLEKLQEIARWDILIIGGGATGLGIAVDAAHRGYATLLVDGEDFAKGTSSRSTKLVHGGVRYLAQGNIGLVTEALRERALLLSNAPHVTRNESFIIPCFTWSKGFYYAAGLTLYDWLAGRRGIGRSRMIGKKEVEQRLPALKSGGLKCGVLYHDGVFDDARLAINLAQTAVERGGVALNYCRVVSLLKEDGYICGAVILDSETGNAFKVKARVVVNATGVFADEVLDMDRPSARPLIKPSQGIHLVLPKSFLQSNDAIMIPETRDGRVLFAVPWHDKVLVGTTDTPLPAASLEPTALPEEIDFVLATAGRYLAREPRRSDVLSVFAGLRPLVATADRTIKTKEISRSHRVIVSPGGLVSVIGGKWTTYRKMAADALGVIVRTGRLPASSETTEKMPIHGHTSGDGAESPLAVYGSDRWSIEELERENPELAAVLDPGTSITAAQVVWAVRNEMARSVEDFLARRTRVLFTDARLASRLAPAVAAIMMKELQRSEEWEKLQVKEFRELSLRYQL